MNRCYLWSTPRTILNNLPEYAPREKRILTSAARVETILRDWSLNRGSCNARHATKERGIDAYLKNPTYLPALGLDDARGVADLRGSARHPAAGQDEDSDQDEAAACRRWGARWAAQGPRGQRPLPGRRLAWQEHDSICWRPPEATPAA